MVGAAVTALQTLEIFQQIQSFFFVQFCAVRVPGIAIATTAGVKQEPVVPLTFQADFVRIKLARSDLEFIGPIFAICRTFIARLGLQQVIERGDRPVVQIRCSRPDAVQGARLVGEQRRVRRAP